MYWVHSNHMIFSWFDSPSSILLSMWFYFVHFISLFYLHKFHFWDLLTRFLTCFHFFYFFIYTRPISLFCLYRFHPIVLVTAIPPCHTNVLFAGVTLHCLLTCVSSCCSVCMGSNPVVSPIYACSGVFSTYGLKYELEY